MRNKYIFGSHICERKTREIIRFFSLDIEAKKTAELTGISRQTINKFYSLFRERIAEICEGESRFWKVREMRAYFFGAHDKRVKAR